MYDYICADCGRTFDQEDVKYYPETRYEPAEYCCPYCGSEAFYKPKECRYCGEDFLEEDLTYGLCENCLWDAFLDKKDRDRFFKESPEDRDVFNDILKNFALFLEQDDEEFRKQYMEKKFQTNEKWFEENSRI